MAQKAVKGRGGIDTTPNPWFMAIGALAIVS
ncbi:hypothetical protein SAMN06298212_11637 [Ruaniaceae bacterium KH17]|nr:hypothetical protein SAMN06298212_11637 [Ruaniaceae bacterium KH17]